MGASVSRIPWLALFVFAVSLAATGAVTWQLDRTIVDKDEERFASAVDRLQDTIAGRIATYVETLRAGVAVVDLVSDLGPREFRLFVDHLDLQTRYPGIQGIGYSRRILPEELATVVAGRRAGGDPAFRVWPEEPRAEYHSILYLEPLDARNQAAIGYDMFTDSTRRAAMAQARDTGAPAASGPVTLVQEIDHDQQPGFLIYMPVYAGGVVPATVAERRQRLRGFVYSPFRTVDLFEGIFGSDLRPRAGFELHDSAAPEIRLYQSSERLDRRFGATRTIDVAGRPWTVDYFSLPALEASSNASLVPIVRWVGIALSLLVAALVALQSAGQRRLEISQRETQAALGTSRETALENARLANTVQDLLASERAARGQAERDSRLKDEFLASLSHELRTPLHAIHGWAHLLATTPLPDAKRQHAIATILRNARVQAQLVEDLLDMSRVISGHLKIDAQIVPLREMVDAAVAVVGPTAEGKRLAVTVHGERPGPSVRGDARRLQQICWNLLANAVKFTPDGGTVEVTVREAGQEAVLEIRDTGIGIASEFLPSVFDRFRQADGSIARSHGGLGLGLSIVKSLVQMHGGAVTAESAGAGRGATFVVRLPLSATSAPAPRLTRRTALPLEPGVLAGLRVLAVDDDSDARDLVQDVLTHYGAQVESVASAKAALDAVTGSAPDHFHLAISDIGLPDKDGYRLIQEIRALAGPRGALPAVALTAYASAEDQARARAAGYHVHLAKPLAPHELVSAVLEVVNGDRGDGR